MSSGRRPAVEPRRGRHLVQLDRERRFLRHVRDLRHVLQRHGVLLHLRQPQRHRLLSV